MDELKVQDPENFNTGKVDKVEIPKDYYKGVKSLLQKRMGELEKQLQYVREKGKTEVVRHIEQKLERCRITDRMLEKSCVSTHEAEQAVRHPKGYSRGILRADRLIEAGKVGVDSAALAATVTAAVSAVDNYKKVMDGKMTPEEAFVDTAKDTAASGGIAFGTEFIATGVSEAMSVSSHHLIRSAGKVGIPAAMVSFGVESYDSMIDYAEGKIDGKTLAYELGSNAAEVGGGMAGMAIAGAAVGSIVPGAGTVVGAAAGIIGGVVGCAVTSEAYKTAVQIGAENAPVLADRARGFAIDAVKFAEKDFPQKAGELAASFNGFAAQNNLPFQISV